MRRAYINKETGEHLKLVPICPKCRASIYWSLISGVEGAHAPAHCANNASATRIITDLENMLICDWEGVVVRMRDGEVNIYDKKKRLVPHKVVRKRFRSP